MFWPLLTHPDGDGDGYGDSSSETQACVAPSGYTGDDQDCDDRNDDIHPNASETCDDEDNDCDGRIDEGDVCGASCTPSTETCNGKDDDCDGSVDEGGVCGVSCTAETCNGKDDDCDGVIDNDLAGPYYIDQDGDGYGLCSNRTSACNYSTDHTATRCGDCDDFSAQQWPDPSTGTCQYLLQNESAEDGMEYWDSETGYTSYPDGLFTDAKDGYRIFQADPQAEGNLFQEIDLYDYTLLHPLSYLDSGDANLIFGGHVQSAEEQDFSFFSVDLYDKKGGTLLSHVDSPSFRKLGGWQQIAYPADVPSGTRFIVFSWEAYYTTGDYTLAMMDSAFVYLQ